MQRLLVCLGVLWMVSGTLGAEEIPVLCGSFPPYCYEKDGRPAGISVEILQAVTKAGGPSFRFDFSQPWVRALEAVRINPKVLILPLTRSTAREPLYQWFASLYSWKGHLVTYARTPPATLAEARNLSVGVSNGSVLVQSLRDLGFTALDIANNDAVNAKKLTLGRLDAWAILDYMDRYEFETQGLDRSLVRLGPQIGGSYVHYLGAGLGFNAATGRAIEQMVIRLRAEGVIDRILAKYE